jgi:hypothetical protein
MAGSKSLVPVERIEKSILLIRGQKVEPPGILEYYLIKATSSEASTSSFVPVMEQRGYLLLPLRTDNCAKADHSG